MQDLPLQVRLVHHVVVDDPQPPDARRGQVERRRRAQPARADQQHLGLEQLRLARLAHLGDEQVAAVAVALRVGEPERNLDGKSRILPRPVPAAQAAHLAVPHFLKRPAGEQAAGTAGAVEHHVRVAVGEGLLDAQLEEPARHLLGAGHDSLIRLLLLAHVDDGRPPRLQLLGQLGRGHLRHLGAGDLEQIRLRLCLCHGTPSDASGPGPILARAAGARSAARLSSNCARGREEN